MGTGAVAQWKSCSNTGDAWGKVVRSNRTGPAILYNEAGYGGMESMLKGSAAQSRAYTSWIKLRDQALEKLYLNAQRKIDDELRGVFLRVVEMISFRYGTLPADQVMTHRARYAIQGIETAINSEFYKAAESIEKIYKDLKRQSYLLAAAGEAEAILRATGKETGIHINQHDLDTVATTTSQGHDILDRILHSFTRVARDLMSSIEYSRIRGEDRQELIPRLLKALPKTKRYKRARRALKPIVRESAKRAPDLEMKAFIPDADWDKMVANYMADFVPDTRGPDDVYDVGDLDTVVDGSNVYGMPADPEADYVEERYGWDLERELANDFVDSVRSGQNDAANQNGIVDFSIIAIIDDHTCDSCCGEFGCVDFDGKTTKEVEAMTNGEQSVPPFHFNCRCTMAPMLDNMPDLEQSNEEEFNQWLNS